MEEQFISAGKEALVTIVKMVQRQRKSGDKGTWKDFLKFHDKQMGDSMSDPAKRSVDDLLAFLRTFSNEEDLKCFGSILRSHSNRTMVEQLSGSSGESESPQQGLVRMTVQHPEYLVEYSFPSHEKEWIVKKLRKTSNRNKPISMIAIDCEMVLCEDGTEAVVQVCVVDQNLEVKFNELVNPNKAIADYRTAITGISAKDLEGVTCSLADIQRSMKKLLRDGTILVGHGLNHDLKALKLDYARVVDTSYIFKFIDAPARRRPSLNGLCKSVLGYELRKEGAPHNCLDDALAAMKLVIAKLEHGYNDGIARSKDVLKSELAKLLLHRIPTVVPKEELHKIFPKDFSPEIQPHPTRKNKYSAIAIFKDPREAHEAFKSIDSKIEKDSRQLPQKLATFELSTGLPASLYVRKMASDDAYALDHQDSSKKRSLQAADTEESKKRKTDSNQCEEHMKEIESLEQKICDRDDEILKLQKIISALTRKHGL